MYYRYPRRHADQPHDTLGSENPSFQNPSDYFGIWVLLAACSFLFSMLFCFPIICGFDPVSMTVTMAHNCPKLNPLLILPMLSLSFYSLVSKNRSLYQISHSGVSNIPKPPTVISLVICSSRPSASRIAQSSSFAAPSHSLIRLLPRLPKRHSYTCDCLVVHAVYYCRVTPSRIGELPFHPGG